MHHPGVCAALPGAYAVADFIRDGQPIEAIVASLSTAAAIVLLGSAWLAVRWLAHRFS